MQRNRRNRKIQRRARCSGFAARESERGRSRGGSSIARRAKHAKKRDDPARDLFLLVPVGIEGLVEALQAPEALDLDCKGGTEANPLVSMLMLLFIPSNDGA